MNTSVRSLIIALVLCLLLPTAAFALDTTPAVGQMLEAVKKRGTLRVGFSTFVPWAMQDKDGNYIGFEIDVATRLAKDLGVTVEFIPTKWSGIIPALTTEQFDIIIAGMSITPERREKVDFTDPYDFAGLDIVANKAKAAGFTSLADFNKPEVIVCARIGGSAKAAIDTHLPKATARYFEEEAQAIQEVSSGRAHAFVSSAPLPAFQAAKQPTILFLPLKETFTQKPVGFAMRKKDTFPKEPVGFAIRKGDPATLNMLNDWIKKAHNDTWLKERKQYWFESTEWEKLLK